MNAEPCVVDFALLAADQPMPLIDRQRIIGERMMVSRVVLHKGFKVDRHRHANEQFAVVVSGEIRFMLGEAGAPSERDVVLTAGQVLVIPANAPHGAEAIETTEVLDMFSPPSETTGVDTG